MLILNGGPPSIIKLAERWQEPVEHVANLKMCHLWGGVKALQCLPVTTSANFQASGCKLNTLILLCCLHNCSAWKNFKLADIVISRVKSPWISG